MTKQRPYGSWSSPITAEMTTRSGIRFGDVVRADGDTVYWVESRPQEGGRSAIVRRSPSGTIDDVGPEDFDARTRVHEYGGAAYAVANDVVYASRFDDQRIYRIGPEGEPQAITPGPEVPGGLRYADLDVRADRAYAVRERHRSEHDTNPTNELVLLDLTAATEPTVVASGSDFYAAPRLSPDGSRLAWIAWDRPNMPWDGSELWVGDVAGDGSIVEAGPVAGGSAESIVQPEWAPEGSLLFASDRSGWWNLYRLGDDEPLLAAEAEFAREPWVFGHRRFVALKDGRVVAAKEGLDGDRLVVIEEGVATEVDLPFSSLGYALAPDATGIYAVASAFDSPTMVVHIDPTDGLYEVVRAPEADPIDPGLVSLPTPISFDTPDGTAHALFYPPANSSFEGPPGEAPPVIVAIHGGPTARVGMGLDIEKLFWTSRGIGIVDVDYGGSGGHGRAYRERLAGRWGDVDVRDCALAAASLAADGKADPERLLIHGGSAGGFTTLMALAMRDEFAAGTASYPVTELEALASDTHKFESRYLDGLVGPFPEMRDLYAERSPITHVDRITKPVLLVQGSDDRVVPPSQPKAMRDALRARGVPVGYLEFPGEGHGFRSAKSRIARLEAELWFYGRVLGFTPTDDLDHVSIEGL